MNLFGKKDVELERTVQAGKESQVEKIRRKEFSIQQAAFVCEESPEDLIRTAEKIYEWIYGEQP